MTACNDPKCPLNRQGVSHENHDSIESKPIKNPCNDPRCAMNRMGMSHETHDGQTNYEEPKQQKHVEYQFGRSPVKRQTNYEEPKQEKPPKQSSDEFHGSADDALHELGRLVNKENPNKLSRGKILEERRKRGRQPIEQEAQEEVKRRENLKQEKVSTKSKIFSRSSSGLPSINQILHSSNPYETFNIEEESTCDDIKSKYKELSKNYNATRGSVNRTSEEQELLTKTQSKINIAYDFLRKKHCG